MRGDDITFSITALCPSCGEALPKHSYLTESKKTDVPFDRDNPYERKDRRVFITPCMQCFTPAHDVAGVVAALEAMLKRVDMDQCHHATTVRGGSIWTICEDCGAEWADDKCGFQPYFDPTEITLARADLSQF